MHGTHYLRREDLGETLRHVVEHRHLVDYPPEHTAKAGVDSHSHVRRSTTGDAVYLGFAQSLEIIGGETTPLAELGDEAIRLINQNSKRSKRGLTIPGWLA